MTEKTSKNPINAGLLSLLRFFLNNDNVPKLIGKCLLLFIIPYAYLILCGLVFDMWLKWYFMTTFIFVSLLVLYAIAFCMITLAFILYVKFKVKR